MKEKINRSSRFLPKTISQFVYDHIKRNIIDNKFIANQKIFEKEIAESLQVSRTPVREAIAQLAAEGYILVDPRHGATVKEISYKEIKNILEVLGALDELAAEQSMDNMSSQDLAKLENVHTRMEKCYQKKEIEKYLNHNFEFHKRIWSSILNSFLRENLYYCLTQYKRYSHALSSIFKHPEYLDDSFKDHIEILEALRRKDKNKLKAFISRHWKPEAAWDSFEKELSNIQ